MTTFAPFAVPEQIWLTGMDPISLFDHQLSWLLGDGSPFEAMFDDDDALELRKSHAFWDLRLENPQQRSNAVIPAEENSKES